MIIGTDFKFRDDIQGTTVPIELLTPPYDGIVYAYDTVNIKEGKDEAILRFTYTFHDLHGWREKKLRKDDAFVKYLGLILNTLIINTLEVSVNGVESDNDREDYSEEPAETGRVREEEPALPEGRILH